jgi:NADH dehydrogenase
MAGAFAELVRGPLKNDHAHAAAHIKINLIEAGPRILPMFSEKLSARAKSDLEKLGVTVHLNTAVAEIKPRSILIKGGDALPSEVTVWAAGVKGEPAGEQLNLPLVNSRIDVDQTLQVKHYPHIFAIGDIAGFVAENGRFLPMVAPVAMQQGRFVAKQIKRLAQGKELENFKYTDKGSMATIGRHKAIVEVGKFRLVGIPAWYAWLWLHLFYLLGGRNKIGTMADWTWNYLTFDRGNRHIMDTL